MAGLARRPPADLAGVTPVAADLLDPESLRGALAEVRPTDVFITTWLRQETEAENIRVNAGMVRNLRDALCSAGSVRHVALVTGLKHYLGPFEAYSAGHPPETPLREDQPRLDLPNFYYDQEDAVFAAAARDGFTWSVHRPHTIIGKAVGNAMNMGTTLACYATLCRELGRPFIFPGSAAQWNGLTDMTDARQLAAQLVEQEGGGGAVGAGQARVTDLEIAEPQIGGDGGECERQDQQEQDQVQAAFDTELLGHPRDVVLPQHRVEAEADERDEQQLHACRRAGRAPVHHEEPDERDQTEDREDLEPDHRGITSSSGCGTGHRRRC